MTISEMAKGDRVHGLEVLVEQKTDSTDKNGKLYCNLTLRDKTGTIQGKVWSNTLSKGDISSVLKEGSVIVAYGEVDAYQGTLQLTISDALQSLTEPSEYYKSSAFNIQEMWEELVSIVDKMKEPLTKFVAEELLLNDAFSKAYKKAPAAKGMHNDWFGGLLEHTHSLCTIAGPVITHYQTRYCKKFSRDKVLFGLLLHDAGKIIEYDYMKPPFNVSPLGKFANHLVLGPAWVYETANKYTKKDDSFKMERAHLMHVLAAHHGTHEFGSPVVPASLEAILVHQLDMIDSRMLHAVSLIDGPSGPIAGFSKKSWAEKTEYFQYV